jgi:hypothetical protein
MLGRAPGRRGAVATLGCWLTKSRCPPDLTTDVGASCHSMFVTTEGIPSSGDEASPNGGHRILATPELDRAVEKLFWTAVDMRMAEDPIFARLGRSRLPEGVRGVSVEIDDSSLDSPQVPMEHSDRVETAHLTGGEMEEFHRIVMAMADSFLAQSLPSFFDHLGNAAESVGNHIDLSGRPLTRDDILDSFDKVEWGVDDFGVVQPPEMVAGPDVVAKVRALPDWTEEQKARWVALVIRKQEEHVSRRRSRRLRHELD